MSSGDNADLKSTFELIDADWIKQSVDNGRFEDYQFEYKTVDDSWVSNARPRPATAKLHERDRENLRRAISGFANGTGGILLWGCDTSQDDFKADRKRLSRVVPILDGERFARLLEAETGTATEPAVNGVIHRSISVGDGLSVVKTFVPASTHAPHKVNTEAGCYYRRDADAFRPMRHFEIMLLANRARSPDLELWGVMSVHERDTMGTATRITLKIQLKNVGGQIAKHSMLCLQCQQGIMSHYANGLDGRGTNGLQYMGQPTVYSPLRYRATAEQVIYQESTHDVCILSLARNPTQSRVSTVDVAYVIYAESMKPVRGIFSLSARELDGRQDNRDIFDGVKLSE